MSFFNGIKMENLTCFQLLSLTICLNIKFDLSDFNHVKDMHEKFQMNG